MNSTVQEPIHLFPRVWDRSELARIPEPNPENWIQPWWDCSVNRLGGPPNPIMRSATNNVPLWGCNPQEKGSACRSKCLCKHTLLIHRAWERVKWWGVEIWSSRHTHTHTQQHVKMAVRINHKGGNAPKNPFKKKKKAQVTRVHWLGTRTIKWQAHRDKKETKTELFLCDAWLLNLDQRKL